MFALLSQWPTSKQFGELEIKKENKVQKGSIIPFPTVPRLTESQQGMELPTVCTKLTQQQEYTSAKFKY